MVSKIMVEVTERVIDPEELLWNIEHDPDSFTKGRRNDDIINWVLAKIMVWNKSEVVWNKSEDDIDIGEDWAKLVKTLSYDQQLYLADYAENDLRHAIKHKVCDCWERYYDLPNHLLENLLIDQGGYAGTYDPNKKKEGN